MKLPCDCRETVEFLYQIGAKHAAEMHRRAAEGIQAHVTTSDVILHAREEEEFFTPLLRKYGMGEQAARIEREHRDKILPDLDRGYIDEVFFAAHSKFEDECVRELKRRMAARQSNGIGAFPRTLARRF